MTEEDLRDRCLALMREGRSMGISGNRESWSTLEGGPGGFHLRFGDVDGTQEGVRPLSEAEAWRMIRTRAAETAFLWSAEEQAAQPVEEVLAYVAAMPRAGR